MDSENCRKIGASWAIAQGLLTALVPQLGVTLFKLLLGTNFENAGELRAKPAYLRQLRAVGIGLAASGVASLVMEAVAGEADDPNADIERTD
jgi:hypothetical protein